MMAVAVYYLFLRLSIDPNRELVIS